MTQLATYDFGSSRIRTSGTPEAPLFCASDVCSALGIENVSQACSKLEPDESELVYVEHISGSKQAIFVNEPGLYSLISGSRKPEAKAFKRWINHEVLPAIRKTGSYLARPMTQAELIAASANALVAIERQQLEQAKRLELLESSAARAESELRDLEAFPEPASTASERTYGQLTYAALKLWAAANNGAYRDATRLLYRDVLERPETRIDLRARLANAKKTGKRKSRLSDIIDATGAAESIYAIAGKLFIKKEH